MVDWWRDRGLIWVKFCSRGGGGGGGASSHCGDDETVEIDQGFKRVRAKNWTLQITFGLVQVIILQHKTNRNNNRLMQEISRFLKIKP